MLRRRTSLVANGAKDASFWVRYPPIACGKLTGQFWQIVPAGKWVRLTTTFRGPNMCLDIDPDSNQPELRPCGNHTGQFWMFARTNR